MWKIDRMAKKVPLDNPRNCDQAKVWDSITVHTWIQNNISFMKSRQLMECGVRGIFGCETNELSFLFFLWLTHQNHGLDCMFSVKNGLQEKRMKYGTQYLSIFLKK